MTDASSPTLPPGTVLVLLPVYNGERFLANQIDSILSQERVQVLLLCRDDASSDRSLDILRDYVARYPEQVRLLEDRLGNLGASANFSVLMQAALAFEAPAALQGQPVYVALADQDDHWHGDKLATGVARIRELEAQHPGLPALVHSDLRVINEDGSEIAPSMARYQGLEPISVPGHGPQDCVKLEYRGSDRLFLVSAVDLLNRQEDDQCRASPPLSAYPCRQGLGDRGLLRDPIGESVRVDEEQPHRRRHHRWRP